MPLARKSSPVLSVSVTAIEPLSPSMNATASPASGSESNVVAAISMPVRNDASYSQLPSEGGLKFALQTLPDVALVLAASPSAAKKPGIVTTSPVSVFVKVTSKR